MEIMKATGNNGMVFTMTMECPVLDDLKDSNAKLLTLIDEYRLYVRETVTRGANIAYINVHCPLMAKDLEAKDGKPDTGLSAQEKEIAAQLGLSETDYIDIKEEAKDVGVKEHERLDPSPEDIRRGACTGNQILNKMLREAKDGS